MSRKTPEKRDATRCRNGREARERTAPAPGRGGGPSASGRKIRRGGAPARTGSPGPLPGSAAVGAGRAPRRRRRVRPVDVRIVLSSLARLSSLCLVDREPRCPVRRTVSLPRSASACQVRRSGRRSGRRGCGGGPGRRAGSAGSGDRRGGDARRLAPFRAFPGRAARWGGAVGGSVLRLRRRLDRPEEKPEEGTPDLSSEWGRRRPGESSGASTGPLRPLPRGPSGGRSGGYTPSVRRAEPVRRNRRPPTCPPSPRPTHHPDRPPGRGRRAVSAELGRRSYSPVCPVVFDCPSIP